jgi:DNA transformation protein and related proteins
MTTEEVLDLDRLAALGEITSRPMFGGVGLYWRGVIFGIVFQNRL